MAVGNHANDNGGNKLDPSRFIKRLTEIKITGVIDTWRSSIRSIRPYCFAGILTVRELQSVPPQMKEMVYPGSCKNI
ncbi:MAG: hypothetical protein CM15mP51_25260 [Porticoccaceae bacterium]|nr:MAG: hypothetical protein CM15mP51_25260 [Porticoccaceae bacterium]